MFGGLFGWDLFTFLNLHVYLAFGGVKQNSETSTLEKAVSEHLNYAHGDK